MPIRARVDSVQRLSPNFLRVFLTGPDFAQVGMAGPALDQRIKLIFPGPGGFLPTFSGAAAWYQEWTAMPEEARGIMRTYSIRALEMTLDSTRMAVDFVLHGTDGPAATWAATAAPGDELLVVAPLRDNPNFGGQEFAPGSAQRVILAGDETAAPAIARILEDIAADPSGFGHLRGEALIEVPTAADALPIAGPDSIAVRWLPREGADHGTLLRQYLGVNGGAGVERDASPELLWETPVFSRLGEELTQPREATGDYYWIAGESGVVTSIRRFLVKERGLDRSQVAFMGYWKKGVAMRS